MSIFESHFVRLTTLGSTVDRVAATPGEIKDSALRFWVRRDHSVWNHESNCQMLWIWQ
jgi:phage gp37-like protein